MPFHLHFPDIPRISWRKFTRRPESLGVYAIVATTIGLGTLFALDNKLDEILERRQHQNPESNGKLKLRPSHDDAEFWSDYFGVVSTF
ncbi:unnamed protein product [Allacma fusca]|uniref:Uncharacterized protein n=1 Tax=Allacma fusca TaxID=39272 RepID=A0A8J2PWR3_9HEXA|nr:unnamed protein product [Allacma fusca]